MTTVATARERNARTMVTRRIGALCMAWAVAIAAGCTSTASEGMEAAATQAAAPVDASGLDDMSFLHDYLARRPTVTVDEAYRAMLILADGHDPSSSFDERRAALEQRGISRAAWKLEADQPIDKGSVAYMVCQILKVRGGLNRVIFGSWGPGDRRYALRELVYRRMMADSPAYRYIAGPELASLLRSADDYMQKHRLYEMESVEIGREPPPGAGVGAAVEPGRSPKK